MRKKNAKTNLMPFFFGHSAAFIGMRQIISTFSSTPKRSIKKQGKLVFIHFFCTFILISTYQEIRFFFCKGERKKYKTKIIANSFLLKTEKGKKAKGKK